MKLTGKQRKALYRLHDAKGRSGFVGVEIEQLAEVLDTSAQGAVATAASLVRRGLAEKFVTTLGGRRRVMYSASPDFDVCPHGCGTLDQHGDASICPKCGDEWRPLGEVGR